MPYVITQNCCNDASCVPVCPTNCIHPTPDEPGYGTAEMLYIDPDGCIECGACLDACPVGAIEPDYDLPEGSMPFLELNATYYADPERKDYGQDPWEEPAGRGWPGSAPTEQLKVAVVGTGPAASYAVQHLQAQRGLDVQIDVFERLLTPGGLVRFGVAPDHQSTKVVSESFDRSLGQRGVRVHLDVEVGVDVTHEQLRERYHAVLYGVGASRPRRLGIPGEELAGSMGAPDFVAWYNGHPDKRDLDVDLTTDRAVVIGNGNVAFDVARVLAAGVEHLGATDIADHALVALGGSRLREIRVVARRGAGVSAFTTPELHGLKELLGDRLIRVEELGPGPAEPGALDDYKMQLIRSLPTEAPAGAGPVVVLDYCRAPVGLLGEERVEGIRLARTEVDATTGAVTVTDVVDEVPAGLVISAAGYRARPLPGLPFDEARSVIPNQDGRVADPATGAVLDGVYVTGWAKRGASGVIGTNRQCARQTVEALLADWAEGVLTSPTEAGDVLELVPQAHGLDTWRRIDSHERSSGRAARRPRIKIVDPAEQLALLAQA
ncbi:FAD-dependent oxidoreductase [Nocardioides alcanivorans]|uniref:FAD-dependent oxidoreductase n=1 Tax=Nocardioides alcanivorans TaxID=2897352 RepID=UPI001F43858C|nr:FAD-dependent oxidoreductase [Nocardioides alcanivorans]